MTVTEHIQNALKASIQSNGALPCKLTLAAISEHFNVSLTPVRYAVEELVQEKVLLRKDNGRLEINQSMREMLSSHSPVVVPMELPNDKLDEAITKEIIELSLQRNGEYLREEATATKYNAGRTVIRQIFSRQAGAGLIEHVPRCGWRVIPFNEKDMLDYLEIRETLELKAMDLARDKFKETELLELLQSNKPSKRKNKPNLDDRLHAYWIDRCDNRYIQEFFARYSDFYSTLFNYASVAEPVRKEMAEEHCDIIENLIKRNWRGARKALSNHIRDQQANVDRVVEYLNRHHS